MNTEANANGGARQKPIPNAMAADGTPFHSLFGPSVIEETSSSTDQQEDVGGGSSPTPPVMDEPDTPPNSKKNITCSQTSPCHEQSLNDDRDDEATQKHDDTVIPSQIRSQAPETNPHEGGQPTHQSTEHRGAQKRPFQEKESVTKQAQTPEHEQEGDIHTVCSPKVQNDIQPTAQLTSKPKTSRAPRPPCKNARDRFFVRQRKRDDILIEHIRKFMEKHGYDIDAADIPPPPPIRRRRGKAQALGDENDDDSDGSIDPDAPEAEAITVKAKDRIKEINEAANGGGLTNRRAGNQREDLKEARLTFGDRKVTDIEKGGETLFRLCGMTALLRSFQLAGAAWMVIRETDDGDHKGGLLADVPGFGKTVMSLAAIVGNPPSPEEISEGIKTTLIVVPNVSTLKQWEAEAKKHLESANSTTFQYKRSLENLTPEILGSMNIVLTTYQELQRGWVPARRRDQLLQECYISTASDDDEETGDYDGEEFHRLCREEADVLFKVKWYRVIFDEVHAVKNVKSETYEAARGLQYTIFWGLSGTPLINSAEELYPYLRLLKWNDVKSWGDYRDRYLKSPDGPDLVDALVNLLTFRRTHHDRFLNKRMIKLPKNYAGTQWVTLTDEERVVYDMTTELLSNPEAPNPGQVTLRQRQAVSHFYLLETIFRAAINSNELKIYIEKLLEVENKRTAVQQIGSWAEREFPGPKPPQCDEGGQLSTMAPFGQSDFGGKFQLTPLLQLFINKQMLLKSTCALCRRGQGCFSDARQLPECGHVFCKDCIVQHWMKQAGVYKPSLCPECGVKFTGNVYDYPKVNTIDTSQQEHLSSGDPPKQKRRKKNTEEAFGEAPNRRPGDDYFGVQPAFGEEKGGLWGKVVLEDMFRNGGIPTPSAKTTAVKEIVLRWLQEDPSHKGIIFTQFVTTALVLGRMLQLENIPFVYLNGKVTGAEKLKAIDGFKGKKEIKYLIASVKCGGQSLDLTCASRTIICDTWWNKATEEQAFGRVLRFGQKKTTHNIRILARDTIDEDIEQMQDDKDRDIKHTMHDDGHKTRVQSEFEITKLLQHEKWLASVQKAIDLVREEAGLMPQGMEIDSAPDEELEEETSSDEAESGMLAAFRELREAQTTMPEKTSFVDLETEYPDEHTPSLNPYGPQDIGREY